MKLENIINGILVIVVLGLSSFMFYSYVWQFRNETTYWGDEFLYDDLWIPEDHEAVESIIAVYSTPIFFVEGYEIGRDENNNREFIFRGKYGLNENSFEFVLPSISADATLFESSRDSEFENKITINSLETPISEILAQQAEYIVEMSVSISVNLKTERETLTSISVLYED